MEQRLANTWRMTVNEKKFIEAAVLSDLRIDGRGLFDYRRLTIKFGGEDGSCEVQLGNTHVMGFVTAQLVQPYRDRPNEGTLSIFTEFSPMADPSFEPGRPGESAIELGRIVDRGLRESKAVDTESLCILAGKLVWAIRIDLHILDNGGNLVDAANISALAALSTFRRPECSLGGEDGQEVIVHPPEAREPLPLIIHHLPIAVTFAFLTEETIVVIDPNHHEEAVMKGRMTVTLDTNGDVCAIQKAGGVGVSHSVIMRCLRIASIKASDVTSKIKNAVKSYDEGRALSKIKRHPSSSAVQFSVQDPVTEVDESKIAHQKADSTHYTDNLSSLGSCDQTTDMDVESPSQRGRTGESNLETENFIGGPSNWDPYCKGFDSEVLKVSLASRGAVSSTRRHPEQSVEKQVPEVDREVPVQNPSLSSTNVSPVESDISRVLTLKDAVKPKNKRKKKSSLGSNPSQGAGHVIHGLQ